MFIFLVIATILIFIMFIYSGIDKIINFNSKVQTLDTKLDKKFPLWLVNLSMFLVILLEIVGSVIIILRVLYLKNPEVSRILLPLSNAVLILFLLFLIIVTALYHPPNKGIIPFFSNCTTFGGIAVLGILLNNKNNFT
jgi:uncharacterized membrane protein YphA (DoxX/SURF4 family)